MAAGLRRKIQAEGKSLRASSAFADLPGGLWGLRAEGSLAATASDAQDPSGTIGECR
jgi:hypothetical protein